MVSDARLNYRRILLSRMKFIGDIVLTTPVIRSVRNAYPDAFIAYLGEKNAVSLLEKNPCLNEVIGFDFSKPGVVEQTRVALLLRRRRFDLAVDLFGNPRTALLTRLSGAPVRVGPERKGRGRLYTIQVRDDEKPKSAIAFHNQYIAAAGIPPTASRTEIFLSDDERREARIYLQWLGEGTGRFDMAKPMIGLHPGATWPAKKWLPERFAELADIITAKFNGQVIVTAGPDDGEVIATMMKHAFSPIKVIKALPLRQLAAVMSHCTAFVSNDAGPMHIAAALGIPTIGLFGPGEEDIWFPYDPAGGNAALRKDVPCHPCHLDFCNRQGNGFMECMKLLEVSDVFRAVEKTLRR